MKCLICQNENRIVNECGCDQNNLPTAPELPRIYLARVDNKFAWLFPVVFGDGENACGAEFTAYSGNHDMERGIKSGIEFFYACRKYDGSVSRDIEPDDLEGGYELIRRVL